MWYGIDKLCTKILLNWWNPNATLCRCYTEYWKCFCAVSKRVKMSYFTLAGFTRGGDSTPIRPCLVTIYGVNIYPTTKESLWVIDNVEKPIIYVTSRIHNVTPALIYRLTIWPRINIRLEISLYFALCSQIFYFISTFYLVYILNTRISNHDWAAASGLEQSI